MKPRDRAPSPQPTRGEALLGPGEFLADGQVGHDGTGLLPSPSGADDPMDRGCEYVACAWACPKRKITGTCDGCSARPVFASGADDVEALVDDLILQARDWDEIVDGDPLRPSVEVARAALLSAIRDREERARREGIEEAARLVDREGCRCTDCRLEPGLDMASRIRALSEREEGTK